MTIKDDLLAATTKAGAAAQILHDVANGPATGAGSTVTTAAGSAKTVAKVIGDADADLASAVGGLAAGVAAAAGSAASASASAAAAQDARIAADDDAAATASDRVSVAADKAIVAADKALVAADKAATAASALAASGSETNALAYRNAAQAAQAAAEVARDAALSAYDSFDDRYLGAKAVAPVLDNDGNALVGGALYFDTVDEAMKLWTGASWVAAYVSGTGYQAHDTDLDWLAANLTIAGKALLDDADAAAQRVTLGLLALALKASIATGDIDADAVTFAKIQNIATSRLLGRSTGGSGDVEEIAIGSGLTLAGGTLSASSSGSPGWAKSAGGVFTDVSQLEFLNISKTMRFTFFITGLSGEGGLAVDYSINNGAGYGNSIDRHYNYSWQDGTSMSFRSNQGGAQSLGTSSPSGYPSTIVEFIINSPQSSNTQKIGMFRSVSTENNVNRICNGVLALKTASAINAMKFTVGGPTFSGQYIAEEIAI